MNLLERIFGKKEDQEVTATAPQDEMPDVNGLESLFVNPEPPAPPRSELPGGIKQFLSGDFFIVGKEDGYLTHSAEVMESKLKVIKADFRNLLSEKIDSVRQEMLELEDHLINIEGVEKRLEKQVKRRLDHYQENKNDLEAEKGLATIDEGHIMLCLHRYREGFIRGIQQYQEEKILASSTGLYN